MRLKAIVLILLMAAAPVWAAEFKAGVARKVITPEGPIWMSGYAARTHASEGVLHDLWAKALALEDESGGRVVLVTLDVIGLPREVTNKIASRVKQEHGLERSQLVLNCSHTHSGPVIWPNLATMYDLLTPAERETLIAYAQRLTDTVVSLVGEALANRGPASLSAGRGSVGFAINRRRPAQGGPQIGVNPEGPVDHDVPVLKVAGADGKIRAVVFGYACHNTTLQAGWYQISGDYAGFAQIEVEKSLPGTQAMFMILCAADQNPEPRGTVELAEKHGKSLGSEVVSVVSGPMIPVRPPIRTAYEEVPLAFAPQDRAVFEKEAESGDRFRKLRAKEMLAAIDAGRPIRELPLPVQVVRLGRDATLVALGGEVVVDYSLRLKRELPDENLVVAGYTNEVPCYIPSLRVLREGGYEADSSMIYYGQPGPFTEAVEDTVIAACRRLLEATRITP